jgi:hypothetical protein
MVPRDVAPAQRPTANAAIEACRFIVARCFGPALRTTTALAVSMKSILDHSFRYTKSIDTDLRKTFARIRREQRQQLQAQNESDNPGKVFPIRQQKHAAVS